MAMRSSLVLSHSKVVKAHKLTAISGVVVLMAASNAVIARPYLKNLYACLN
ncbi:MAG: hypothetical protein JW945_04465 [Methanomicrobia archaeon]|nr:hypothetical protein [Methanomicrobia archaeon]